MTTSSILSVTNLTRNFGGFVAVKDVNLEVRKGSIHALIGPNGAGKTTVFNLLTKVLQPSKGRITFQGEDITSVAPADVARRGMVRSFQISAVFPQLTVVDNLRLALQRRSGLATQFWLSTKALHRLDSRADELMEAVNLGSFALSRAAALPYGRKRALELATTLALDPTFLLLDEPMAGMGHEDIGQISALIKRIAIGRTVLMVEHNLNVVAEICDQVTVLARGEILVEGSYAQVSSDYRVREAYMGTEDD